MKYMLIFAGTRDYNDEWAKRSDEEKAEGYARIGEWFGKHGSKVLHTDELQSTATATTVRFEGGTPVVTDGPFMEAKESIGGYAVVDVEDLDAALELARTWPAQGIVEVRPIVPREG